MQPHSMCAVALSYYTWMNDKRYNSCQMKVKYKRDGRERIMYYNLKEIEYSPKRLAVSIVRSGGGLACRITAKLEVNERVEMVHGTQHIAGLTEIFTVRKKEIIGGEHKHSEKYRNFRGKVKVDHIGEDTKVELTCEVKSARGNDFYEIEYELSLESRDEKKQHQPTQQLVHA